MHQIVGLFVRLLDVEDTCFGLVQQVEHVGRVIVRTVDDVGGKVDKLPLEVFLLDDPRMEFDVGCRGYPLGELHQVIVPAYGIQMALGAQLVADREQVDGLAVVVQVDDGGVNIAVLRLVKHLVVVLKDIHHTVGRATVYHQRPQDCLFEIRGLGRPPSGCQGNHRRGRRSPAGRISFRIFHEGKATTFFASLFESAPVSYQQFFHNGLRLLWVYPKHLFGCFSPGQMFPGVSPGTLFSAHALSSDRLPSRLPIRDKPGKKNTPGMLSGCTSLSKGRHRRNEGNTEVRMPPFNP